MLKIADNLSLPIEAVTQKFAFLGRTGSGKTYGAMKLAELMLDAQAQIVALDGIGVWYGLRLKADGKSKGYSIPVFGGEQGDVPLEPQAGRLIAKLIVDEQFSAVLDVSNFRKHERKTFVTDFAEELFHRKKTNRSALHFFCEESQMFIPERSGKEGARMLGAFEDLIKLGRNYGIGASLISQRPQAVNKEVLNQTEVLLAFQMTGIHERKAIAAWISEKGIDGGEKLEDLLPSLKVGDAKVWSPQWLRKSLIIHIAKKVTYDASSTPTVGAAIVKPKELSPVDVEQIKSAMGDVVKRAEENDPKKLKAEILKLRRDVEQAQTAIPQAVAEVATKVEIKEVPVIPEKAIKALTAEIAGFRKDYIGKLDVIAKGFEALNGAKALGKIEDAANKLISNIPQNFTNPPKPIQNLKSHAVSSIPASRKIPEKMASSITGDYRSFLNPKQQKMIDTLLTFESLGRPSIDRAIVATFSGMSSRSGTFGTYMSSLKNGREGEFPPLIDYLPNSCVALTQEGRDSATSSIRIDSIDDLHSAWAEQVKTPKQVEMLSLIIAQHPTPVTREEISEFTGLSATSGTFGTYLSGLKSLGIIDYVNTPNGRGVKATDLLFPEGLS